MFLRHLRGEGFGNSRCQWFFTEKITNAYFKQLFSRFYDQIIIKLNLNLWLTAPKGATPVNQTSTTDWQMAVRRDIVISITLRRLIMSTFLIKSPTSQSSSYPIVLTRLGGSHSRPNPHLKFVKVLGIEPATLIFIIIINNF